VFNISKEKCRTGESFEMDPRESRSQQQVDQGAIIRKELLQIKVSNQRIMDSFWVSNPKCLDLHYIYSDLFSYLRSNISSKLNVFDAVYYNHELLKLVSDIEILCKEKVKL